MKMKTKTKITEALFEVLGNTDYKKEGEAYLKRILNNKNISFNPSNNTITLETYDGSRVLHTITIS